MARIPRKPDIDRMRRRERRTQERIRKKEIEDFPAAAGGGFPELYMVLADGAGLSAGGTGGSLNGTWQMLYHNEWVDSAGVFDDTLGYAPPAGYYLVTVNLGVVASGGLISLGITRNVGGNPLVGRTYTSRVLVASSDIQHVTFSDIIDWNPAAYAGSGGSTGIHAIVQGQSGDAFDGSGVADFAAFKVGDL